MEHFWKVDWRQAFVTRAKSITSTTKFHLTPVEGISPGDEWHLFSMRTRYFLSRLFYDQVELWEIFPDGVTKPLGIFRYKYFSYGRIDLGRGGVIEDELVTDRDLCLVRSYQCSGVYRYRKSTGELFRDSTFVQIDQPEYVFRDRIFMDGGAYFGEYRFSYSGGVMWCKSLITDKEFPLTLSGKFRGGFVFKEKVYLLVRSHDDKKYYLARPKIPDCVK